MTDVAVDTVRLRGPHARRLAAVAARALPTALDRALADVDDVHVDEVVVTLDLDVTAYDDETLAVLWADAIRTQVLAARPDPKPDAAPRTPMRHPTVTRALGPMDVLAGIRALGATGPGPGTILPRAVLMLADPLTARAVADVAGPDEWASLLRMLTRTLRLPGPDQNSPGQVPVAPADPAEAVPARLLPAPESTVPGAQELTADEADVATEQVELPYRPGAVLDVLDVLARLVDEHATTVEAAAVTRVAGLVLLYPWLAEHCRRAQDLHPGLDGLDVREAAVAAIIDSDDPALADDPLVGLLAGRRSPRPGGIRLPLPRREEVAESAVQLLMSFAALLPGFGRSSPGFVRDSWIARFGVVDVDRDPALLIAAAHPLDVVLARLPYPVGLIKLPWSPPLAVQFRS
ncbi:contractile injection system tape measure protein [Streptomyces sp. NPDC050534]|uniref:contractile injection system tape measure protein n=1 Tax=Streptomyces sp. NPDC050534 TaxID=3365625 RepID=UPI003788CCB1